MQGVESSALLIYLLDSYHLHPLKNLLYIEIILNIANKLD